MIETAEEMALAQELEAAYYAKTGEYPTMIYDFDAEIQDSQYKPYQIVEVSIGGGRGSFYRTSSDAEWQYFAVFQAPRGCDEYNTEDLKKAYAGRVCYNAGAESVVQP